MNVQQAANQSMLSQAVSSSPLYPFSSPISSHKLVNKEKPLVPQLMSMQRAHIMRDHLITLEEDSQREESKPRVSPLPLHQPISPIPRRVPEISLDLTGQIEKARMPPPRVGVELNQPETKDNFNVFVRVRPLLQRELRAQQRDIITISENMIFAGCQVNYVPGYYMQNREKGYAFKGVFGRECTTLNIFQQTMEPKIPLLLKGFNLTCFAYGMTGSGKTFSMFGSGGVQNNISANGLCWMSIFRLLQAARAFPGRFSIKMSFLQIYNEQIRDLLCTTQHGIRLQQQNLMIVEDQSKGVQVHALTQIEVQSPAQVSQLIESGTKLRIQAPTKFNQVSSRSHALVQFSVEEINASNHAKNFQENSIYSKLVLVDLAGSERAAVTENRGIRMREGANINRSLLALGNCINVLTEQSKHSGSTFVPYRDSKLTRLLKDSLGGNTCSYMIACISPSFDCYEETTNTLKYAERAQKIKKAVVSNKREFKVHVSQYKTIIMNLKSEIEQLKRELIKRNTPLQGVERETLRKSLLMNPDPEMEKAVEEERVVESQLEQLSENLLQNLEEGLEIKQSLSEIQKLKQENEEALDKLGVRDYTSEPNVNEINKIKIAEIRMSMQTNDEYHEKLVSNLEENEKAKEKLLGLIRELKESSKRGQKELFNSLRILREQKANLENQNIEIKKRIREEEEKQRAKDSQIEKMSRELEALKLKLKTQESRLKTPSHSKVRNNALSSTSRTFYRNEGSANRRELNKSSESDKIFSVPQPKFSQTLTSFKATPQTPEHSEEQPTPVFKKKIKYFEAQKEQQPYHNAAPKASRNLNKNSLTENAPFNSPRYVTRKQFISNLQVPRKFPIKMKRGSGVESKYPPPRQEKGPLTSPYLNILKHSSYKQQSLQHKQYQRLTSQAQNNSASRPGNSISKYRSKMINVEIDSSLGKNLAGSVMKTPVKKIPNFYGKLEESKSARGSGDTRQKRQNFFVPQICEHPLQMVKKQSNQSQISYSQSSALNTRGSSIQREKSDAIIYFAGAHKETPGKNRSMADLHARKSIQVPLKQTPQIAETYKTKRTSYDESPFSSNSTVKKNDTILPPVGRAYLTPDVSSIATENGATSTPSLPFINQNSPSHFALGPPVFHAKRMSNSNVMNATPVMSSIEQELMSSRALPPPVTAQKNEHGTQFFDGKIRLASVSPVGSKSTEEGRLNHIEVASMRMIQRPHYGGEQKRNIPLSSQHILAKYLNVYTPK